MEKIRYIYPIINLEPGETVDPEFLERVKSLNPRRVQLRIKNGADEDFLKNGKIIKKLFEGTETVLFMNDRPDMAVETGFHGVHLGHEDIISLGYETVAKNYPELLVGISTHTIDQVEAAGKLPIDNIGFGPVFPTSTKDTPWSHVRDIVEKAAEVSAHPVIFIGGIDRDNYTSLPLGSNRYFAVISSLGDFLSPVN